MLSICRSLRSLSVEPKNSFAVHEVLHFTSTHRSSDEAHGSDDILVACHVMKLTKASTHQCKLQVLPVMPTAKMTASAG